ncbi:methyltransferase domain-containing protein [Streptomyces sp. 769]|uniref:methyltransferase domain-containing protein n=1 Tax=Streptomyces sp. 769 TaxID=1262452 RepID=UPI000A6759C0|nr:methyltransferase domain-containing protein [Streptomyces sp. 769]
MSETSPSPSPSRVDVVLPCLGGAQALPWVPDRIAQGRRATDIAAAAQPHAPTPATGRPAPAEPRDPWTDQPYAHALRTGSGPLFLRRLSPSDSAQGPGWRGDLLPLDIERWCAVPDAADSSVLRRCTGPVLDAGCGPGRLVAALSAQGVPALGIDVSPTAVACTRRLGGRAVRRSVFDRLPQEGRWGTVLLMDGNIGIGGDPIGLLDRLRTVVAPGGRLLTEAAPHDVDERLTARVEDARGRHGRPFPWARLGTNALLHAADATGWLPTGRWAVDGRPFVALRRSGTERMPNGGPRADCSS